ncbi:MAG: sugar phosphate nucleotidyltransferase, partial [Elusimicrobia bacterium]|nr:sugar phosphate nucleotidyltransferase [Elusimicrobiota bacterium]
MKVPTASNRWSIVLSGGDGQRMSPFIQRWLGHPRPKQYCSFAGGRTMLEHTLDRALDASEPERIVTVINRDHRRFLKSPRHLEIPGRIVAQPCRRDTGPGVFLPLTHVMASDSKALVAIMPSDHFIHPRKKFAALMDEAFGLAESLPGRLVLLAARPDGAEQEYGWISPGAPLPGGAALRVNGFREKPRQAQADDLYRQGGLWNTMIVVARASALWDIAHEVQPEMAGIFGALKGWLGRPEEEEALALSYQEMP